MNKSVIHAVISVFMLISLATSVSAASWTRTTQMTSNDSTINFINLYNNASNVFAQTWDTINGHRVFLTTNGGASWAPIASADSNIDVLSIVMVSSTNLLAGTFNGLYQSTNGGTSWTSFSPTGIPVDTVIWSLAMINDTIFAGAMGDVYISKDHGTTWADVKSGLPGTPTVRINSIATSGNGIFAGSDSNGVFKSTDGPATWTAFNSGSLDSISMHINQLVPMGNKLFAITLRGAYVSANNGTTWTAVAPGLKLRCLAVANNILVAGTDSSGVYASRDSGVTWSPANPQLPARTRVWSLVVSGTTLFAGTNSGVWSTAATVNTVMNSSFSGAAKSGLQITRQNGSRIAVEFVLPSSETVDLALYDLHGNRVASLVHEKFGAGLQKCSFNSRSIAKGSYIVRLTAGKVIYQQNVPILR